MKKVTVWLAGGSLFVSALCWAFIAGVFLWPWGYYQGWEALGYAAMWYWYGVPTIIMMLVLAVVAMILAFKRTEDTEADLKAIKQTKRAKAVSFASLVLQALPVLLFGGLWLVALIFA